MRVWLSYAFVPAVQAVKCCARVAWVRPSVCCPAGQHPSRHVHAGHLAATCYFVLASTVAGEWRGSVRGVGGFDPAAGPSFGNSECDEPDASRVTDVNDTARRAS